MKTQIYIFTVLACVSAQASLLLPIPSPQDDTALKYALWQEPAVASTLETERRELYELEEVLRTLKESQLKKVFGPEKPLEDSYVLPFCRHTAVGFSGLGYKGELKMYFLPIGNVGGVLVFPYGDRDFVSAVALYLKTDETFQPLRKQDSLEARQEWDHRRLAELKAVILKSIEIPNKAVDSTANPTFHSLAVAAQL
tara:strand:+ start:1086 stop:1676 length:591 start_codon:yes stop_codon:yes gene_type:complete